METPVQRCVRIMAALEDLVDQEAAALTNADWDAMIALQGRVGPLVDFLTTHASDGVARLELGERLPALHARRNQTSSALARQIECVRNELHQTRVARVRVAQIAPAYGGDTDIVHRLQVVG